MPYCGNPAEIPRLEVGDHVLVTLCDIPTGKPLPPKPAVVERFDHFGNGFRSFPDLDFRARYLEPDPMGPPFRRLSYADFKTQWKPHNILDRLAAV